MKLLIAAAALLALQDEKVDLKWKFQKGQELRYRVSNKSTVDMAAMTLEHSTKTTFSYAVTDVAEDGSAAITVKYEAVATQATGPMEYDYDSEKQKEPPAHPAVQAMSRIVGQSFSLKMDPSGKVREVKGLDKMLEALFKAGEDDPQAALARQMLKQNFSDEAIRSNMQQMFMPLPEGRVGKGDSWKNDLTAQVPMVGKMTLASQTRLADVKGRDAHLEQEWKLEPKEGGEPDKEKNPMAGMIQITGMKAKAKGVFSLERGLFLYAQVDSTMTMSAGGQEMEARVVNETRLLDGKAGDKKGF